MQGDRIAHAKTFPQRANAVERELAFRGGQFRGRVQGAHPGCLALHEGAVDVHEALGAPPAVRGDRAPADLVRGPVRGEGIALGRRQDAGMAVGELERQPWRAEPRQRLDFAPQRFAIGRILRQNRLIVGEDLEVVRVGGARRGGAKCNRQQDQKDAQHAR